MVTPPSDGGGVDAGSSLCTEDLQCDDGLYCNGAERCDPAASGADSDGCVAGAGPCMPTQSCDESDDRCVTECPVERDADDDGVDAIACGGRDCDDADPSAFPGALEICDPEDRDEDCDSTTFGIRDLDTDGEPDAQCCNAGPSGPICGSDCDDTRAGVSPLATETCDERDNDCDGSVDESVRTTYYPDTDGDSFGDPLGAPMLACFQPTGYAETATDCDDTRSAVSPGAAERCDPEMVDEDCSGTSNPPELCDCTNGDAQGCTLGGACASGTETCIDGAWSECSIAAVVETCNTIDDDCDGVADEMLTLACYTDSDNDGWPDDAAALRSECPVAARVAVGGCPLNTTNRTPVAMNVDCEPGDALRHPTAMERCNALDEDCDGVVDDGVQIVCYTDLDNDTYAASTPARMECAVDDRVAVGGCPLGTTSRAPATGSIDCDDGEASRRPGASEICVSGTMAVDDDCDGNVDEGVAVTCYPDGDNDSYAPMSAASSMQCRDALRSTLGFCPISYTNRVPSGTTSSDCNPTNGGVHPAAVENCDLDAVDENCDGVGNPVSLCACVNGTTQMCTLPGVCSGGMQICSAGAWGACSVTPVPDICDGRDEDCDGVVDEGLTVTCYTDSDNDTYPQAGAAAQAQCPVSGRGAVGGCPINLTNRAPTAGMFDCNDVAPTVHPDASETCTEGMTVDEDCDGAVDEALRVTCFADGDSDTYAPSSAGAAMLCRDPARAAVGNCPASYTNRAPVGGAVDCNDGSGSTNPAASEICDRLDSNCSSGGGVALDEDADGDLHSPATATCTPGFPKDDCDDAIATVHPGAAELCDRVDSNCSSGGGSDGNEDSDRDGHTALANLSACSGGYPIDDCQDSNALVHPGQGAWFTNGYCGSGSGTYCAIANTSICGVCEPGFYTLASFDYDCSGAPVRQPNETCGATVCVSSCYSRPISATHACGAPTTIQTCMCGGVRCTAGTTVAGNMPCH